MAISCIVCGRMVEMVENRSIFIPHLYLAPPQGVTPSEFREGVYARKTGMIGLPYGEKTMTIC